MQSATILTGKTQIDGARYAVVEKCLKLQTKGMRHSRGPVATIAARDILTSAGISPARSVAKLYEQFKEWRENWNKSNGF